MTAKVSPPGRLAICLPACPAERSEPCSFRPAAAPPLRLPPHPLPPSHTRDRSLPAIADTSENGNPSVPIDTGKRAIPGPIVCDGNARNRHKGPPVGAPPMRGMKNSLAQNTKMSKRGCFGEASGCLPSASSQHYQRLCTARVDASVPCASGAGWAHWLDSLESKTSARRPSLAPPAARSGAAVLCLCTGSRWRSLCPGS